MNSQPQMMTRKKVFGYGEFFLCSENIIDQTATKEILDGNVYPMVVSQASIIWDIGANIGAAARWFRKCYPAAEIHCFEPSRDIVWECLQENTGAIRGCTLHNYGLAAIREKRSMNEWGGATVTRSCRHQKVVTSQEFPACFFQVPPAEHRKVSIVKIDTEGCEVEILEAMKYKHKIPVFYLEYHSDADRRRIDQLLPEHHLMRASADGKHRGNLCYLRRDISTTEDQSEIT